MSKSQNIFDNQEFFDGYKRIRSNRYSANNLEEKPALFSLSPDLSAKAVLDLGCGYGKNCAEFKERGASRVLGIDISEKMLEVATAEHPDIEFLRADMSDLSFVKEKYDVVFSIKDFYKNGTNSVGGGVIGLEMASYFNTAGSKVTVIEMMDKIAGPTDREISEILLKNYQKKGITFNLGCKVVGVEPGKVLYELEGKTYEVPSDKVLLSIGRRAFTEGLGLETIGVETERGKIKTDNKGLFASSIEETTTFS